MFRYVRQILAGFLVLAIGGVFFLQSQEAKAVDFFDWSSAPTYSGEWTLIVIPDTQRLVANNSSALTTMVDHIDGLSPEFILHVGDIVNNGASSAEWSTASTSFDAFQDNAILYGIGNHDYDDDAQGASTDRDTTPLSTAFNSFWPISRINTQNWFVDSYPTNKTENSAAGIVVDGVRYLFLSIEMFPRQAAVDWADAVIASTSPDRIIVTTHMNLTPDGSNQNYADLQGGQGDSPEAYSVCGDATTTDCMSGEEFYNNFISQNEKIVLVVNGHDLANTTGANGTQSESAFAKRTETINGKLVHQNLVNFQNVSANTYADSAYYRNYTFSGNTIDVTTYNPVQDTSLTDAENQFTLNMTPLLPPNKKLDARNVTFSNIEFR